MHELARVDLCHATNAARAQARILVAVSPRVDGALDEAALPPQAGVELGEGPADGVALALVDEAVAAVLVLGAAGAGVDAVLGLEFGGQRVDGYGLDVAPDRVLHLDAVARVLKGDPLDAVAVLADDEGGCGRDWTRSCGGVDAGPWERWCAVGRRWDVLESVWGLWLALWRCCGGALLLLLGRVLHLGYARAAGHLLWVLAGVLHLVLRLWV